jgi:hypothetical protein
MSTPRKQYIAIKNWDRYQCDSKGQVRNTPSPWIKDWCNKEDDYEYTQLNSSRRYTYDALRRLRGRYGKNPTHDLEYLRNQLSLKKGDRENLGPTIKKLWELRLVVIVFSEIGDDLLADDIVPEEDIDFEQKSPSLAHGAPIVSPSLAHGAPIVSPSLAHGAPTTLDVTSIELLPISEKREEKEEEEEEEEEEESPPPPDDDLIPGESRENPAPLLSSSSSSSPVAFGVGPCPPDFDFGAYKIPMDSRNLPHPSFWNPLPADWKDGYRVWKKGKDDEAEKARFKSRPPAKAEGKKTSEYQATQGVFDPATYAKKIGKYSAEFVHDLCKWEWDLNEDHDHYWCWIVTEEDLIKQFDKIIKHKQEQEKKSQYQKKDPKKKFHQTLKGNINDYNIH